MESSVSGLGAALAIVTVALIAVVPRSVALAPILAAACFVSTIQSFQVAGVDFYVFRVMLLAALCRVVIRGEARELRWCRLDTLVLSWSGAVMLFGSLSQPGWPGLMGVAGSLYNGLVSYIVCRAVMRSRQDLLFQLRFLAVIAVPVALAMALEKLTGRNVFSVFGGVPEITIIRDGALRAQGAFRHPILAGSYGATLLPLMVAIARMPSRRYRTFGSVGTVCAVFIAWAAASSGAFLAAAGGIGALCLWPWRRSLRWIRLGAVAVLLLLQARMSRPIWWIFDAIGDITGGTGWHRSYIIDAAIRHWQEWILTGTPVTAHWGGYPPPPNDPNNIDLTNQFIVEAVGGGIVRLALFVAMIWLCFRSLGRALHARRGAIRPETEWLAWCVAVALLVHCVCFFSVAYYDQMIFYWFWLLSLIAAGTMQASWLVRDRAASPAAREPRPQPQGSALPAREPAPARLGALFGPRRERSGP